MRRDTRARVLSAVTTRLVVRWVAALLAIAVLATVSMRAEAPRLTAGSKPNGCTRNENPTMKIHYTNERMKAVFRFAKKCYPGGSTFENVTATVSRILPDGTGEGLGRGKSCDTATTCWLAVKIPHPEIETAQYEFRVDWRGMHGHARKRKTEPISCTSTPVLAQCDEPANS